MPDIDHDEPRFVHRGPGRRHSTTGANIEIYADGAIDLHCPNCGAQPLQFCRWPEGRERKLPCPQRRKSA